MTESSSNQVEELSSNPVPELGNRVQNNSWLTKAVMFVIACLMIVLLVAINGGFSHAKSDSNSAQHHYTIADHLGAPPEPEQHSKPTKATTPTADKSSIIHTGQLDEPNSPQFSHLARLSGQKKTLTPQQRKQLDDLLVLNNSSQQTVSRNIQQRESLPDLNQAQPDSHSLNQQLQASKIQGSIASRIIDPNLFITKGAFLDCILETAISSDVAGMTRCQLSRDIYSTNGKVLLLEKGSHIVGEYQAGLEQGQARIFVLWDRIETPTGVILDLASPGTDSLGRSGHTGYVDGHFGQRFGSAMLLSLIGDVGTYYANKSKGNSNKIQFGDTIGGTKDLASIALQDSIHIKPTLYKNQGEHINVFVARDLDFRSVYELKLSQ
ncbi:TrbI/VirB10 family protein [Parashewanella curva]|uniref:TrbI/VirB10 family protein n=2 Tax=Parashewanella curva TaxID=2338552 RepID=A0A3L8PSU9_9GAMM|nr:type IV secretion system protein VirB10 [Parashewanella curva]RLV58324.1 TrbI/VirB10 family protein [Parashewanella curva]